MSKRVLACTGILALSWSFLAAVGAPPALAAKQRPAGTTTSSLPTDAPSTTTTMSTTRPPRTTTTTTPPVTHSSLSTSGPTPATVAPDGSGTMTVAPTGVSASSAHNTLTFTYSAPVGGLSGATVTLQVPSNWSSPTTNPTGSAFAKASTGTLTISSKTITVSGVTLAGGGALTITYGDKSQGGAGVTAPGTPAVNTWTTMEKSSAGGTLTTLATSPSVTVAAKDGTGTLTTTTKNVSASSHGNTIVFTFTAPVGGVNGGEVTITAPSGWSQPSTTSSAPGDVTSSAGTVSVNGQAFTVSGLTLTVGQQVTITYGDQTSGPGATASSTVGAQKWLTQERSSSTGTFKLLSASPSITVNAADGSGTMTSPTAAVRQLSNGNTIVFTFKAPVGGMVNGAVTLTVPADWPAPSTNTTDPGFSKTNSSTLPLQVSGHTITVSNVTKSSGSTFTITYGFKTSGAGQGVGAPGNPESETWTAQERSTSAGTLTNLGASPVIVIPDHTIEASGVNGCAASPGGGSGRFCFMPNTFNTTTGSTVFFANFTGATHDVDRCGVSPEHPVNPCPVGGGTGTDDFGGSPDLHPQSQSGFDHTYSFTFSGGGAGTYNYFCSIHGYAVMHGTITVF